MNPLKLLAEMYSMAVALLTLAWMGLLYALEMASNGTETA